MLCSHQFATAMRTFRLFAHESAKNFGVDTLKGSTATAAVSNFPPVKLQTSNLAVSVHDFLLFFKDALVLDHPRGQRRKSANSALYIVGQINRSFGTGYGIDFIGHRILIIRKYRTDDRYRK